MVGTPVKPYADCGTCWGLGLVYQLPARKVWVRGRWIESCLIRCPDCNAEVARG